MIALKIVGPFNWVFEKRLQQRAHVEIHRGPCNYNGTEVTSDMVLIIPLDENSKNHVDKIYGKTGLWIEV